MGSDLNFKGFVSTAPIGANAMRPQEIHSLSRQPSVYSLTFDEFHNTWGSGLRKDVGSMNMDELLKNIWSVEETQTMTNSVAVGNLQRQGSLTLPRTLSQKTVDEVWRDLINETTAGVIDGTGGVGSNVPQRQPTLGDMTLEDFLVRAGAVRADTPQTGMATDGLALGFQLPNQSNVFFGTRMMENDNSLAPSQPLNSGLNVGGVRSVQKLPQQQQKLHLPLFPKPATAAYVAQSTNSSSVHGVGMCMVGSGTGGIRAATTPSDTPSNWYP